MVTIYADESNGEAEGQPVAAIAGIDILYAIYLPNLAPPEVAIQFKNLPAPTEFTFLTKEAAHRFFREVHSEIARREQEG